MWKYQILIQWNYCVSSLKAFPSLEHQISKIANFKVAGIKADIVQVSGLLGVLVERTTPTP